MKTLKQQNLNQCFSLLREFIDETEGKSSKKGVAVLALNHLKKITAGDDTGKEVPIPAGAGGASTEGGDPMCHEMPMADS